MYESEKIESYFEELSPEIISTASLSSIERTSHRVKHDFDSILSQSHRDNRISSRF